MSNYRSVSAKPLPDNQDVKSFTSGIPLHHTLGSPTRSLDEVYGRLGDLPFTAEFKYDGQRAQIHARRSEYKFFIRIFSRHLEDMTDKVLALLKFLNHMVTNSFSVPRRYVSSARNFRYSHRPRLLHLRHGDSSNKSDRWRSKDISGAIQSPSKRRKT